MLRRRLTLLVMCLATFMIQLDVTVVNVALPRIQADLGMTASGLEWVISAYALSLAALIPAGGVLGDRYGRKRVFLAGLAIFAAGSAACALSPEPRAARRRTWVAPASRPWPGRSARPTGSPRPRHSSTATSWPSGPARAACCWPR